MKKILVGLVGCLADFANATTLDCKNSYPLFKEIIQKKTDANHIGDVDDIYNYIQNYDYPQIFNKNHPDKQFWVDKHLSFAKSSWSNNEWISKSEYNKRIKLIAQRNVKNASNPYIHELLPAKANLLTQSGEICVVPVQAYLEVKGDAEPDEGEDQHTSESVVVEAMLIDHIFVRDIKANKWRVLAFDRFIADNDFNEFFPDLPDHIKNELNDGIEEAAEAMVEQIESQE